MKKMFSVLILLVAFIGTLTALKPNHDYDEILKSADEKYAVVFTSNGEKKMYY